MKTRLRKRFCLFLLALILITSFSKVADTSSLSNVTTVLNPNSESGEDDFGKANIGVSAYRNLTLVPVNNTVDLGLSAEIIPTNLTLYSVDGFEPVQRFSSELTYKFERDGNSVNYSLTELYDGLHLSFNPKSTSHASISVYNVSFTNSQNISRNDFLSLAISTGSIYNSAEGYIGIALLLRDQQGNRHYLSFHISNRFSADSYSVGKWFLGYSYGKDFPVYSFRYGASFGPWFMQLSLLKAFESLNLSSAWLDGLLIGVELYSEPLPYSMTQANVSFNYVLVHPEIFSINDRVVNSTDLTFPTTRFIKISGISCKALNATLTGSLEPSYQKEEQEENQTVKNIEVFYNFSEARIGDIRFEGDVKITVSSKTVRNCTITLNNETTVDLTDSLLNSNRKVYRFPANTLTLKVFLSFYKFNAWLFSVFSYANLVQMTKKGIVQETFIPDRNESEVIVDLNQANLQETKVAVRAGNFSCGEILINGIKKPLDSLLMLDNDMFLATSVQAEENVSLYTIKISFSSNPLYASSTVQPFKLFMDGALFDIYTPFNIEADLETLIPITIRLFTSKTYLLRVEYDSSMFKIDNNEIMVNKPAGYKYFMLNPVRIGHAVITVNFEDPTTENSISIQFLVNVEDPLFYPVVQYALLIITVLSLVYVASSKNLVDWLLHRLKREK